MSASGVDDFAAADDLTLLEGMAARGAAWACRSPCTPRARRSPAASRAARSPRGGSACATTWPRGRSSPSSRRSAARSRLPRRPAARCTSSTSPPAAASRSSRRRARAASTPRCETCPHYLVLDADDAERLGAVAKCAPPLRPAGEVDALWAALRDGDADLVASDHSPSPAALKEGDDASRPGAGSPVPRRCWRCSRRGRLGLCLRRRAGELPPRLPRGASAWCRPRARWRWAPTPTWRSSTSAMTCCARSSSTPPPQPVRGPHAARPSRANDPAGRTIAWDGRVAGEPPAGSCTPRARLPA